MEEVQAVASINLDAFSDKWLYQKAFQAEDALQSLTKSAFMKQYFELQALRPVPFDQKESALQTAIASNNDYLGQEAVYQLANEPLTAAVKQLYATVILGGNVFMKQAIAQSISNTETFGICLLYTSPSPRDRG